MIWRTFDAEFVEKCLEPYRDDLKGLPASIWLSDKENIALRDHAENLALFEYRQPGVYCGHYFFKDRGRKAIDAAEDFLHEIFSGDRYPVHIIIGFTPLDKLGALWMSNHLGFTNTGDEDIDGRPHRVFILTKQDYISD